MLRFKKSVIDEGNYTLYEPTVYVKDSVLVSDKFAKEKRMNKGGLDVSFLIKRKKR